jgi:hypothetical protein
MLHPTPTTTEMAFFFSITTIYIILTTKQRKPLDLVGITAISLLTTLSFASIVILRTTNLAATFAIAALCCTRK